MAPWKDYLKDIYYNPSHPASFSGPQKLYKVVKNEGKFNIGMYKIRKFLHNQESYSLHKPVRRRFQRNHVISAGKDDLWMADLMDMVKFKDWNKGYKYILLVIDTFSKYVWLTPLKTKSGQDVKDAFQEILKTSGRSPNKIITDKGMNCILLLKIGYETGNHTQTIDLYCLDTWRRLHQSRLEICRHKLVSVYKSVILYDI